MSVESQVPDAGTPIFDKGGYINPVWHQFFFTLLRRTGGAAGVDLGSESQRITVVEGRVEATEQGIEAVVPKQQQTSSPLVELAPVPARPAVDGIQYVPSHGIQNDPDLHALATQIFPGFMSASDKAKIDGFTSGSSAAGEWVKFTDGTMLQKLVIPSLSIAVTTAYGTTFWGPSATLSWTFPVPFVGVQPACRVEPYSTNRLAYGVLATIPTLTGATFVVKDETTYTANFNLTYWAYGRWK